MRSIGILVLTLVMGLTSVEESHAQLGKLKKKVTNKVKTEERKAKKAISNTKKTGNLPKTTETTTPSVKPTTPSASKTPTGNNNTPKITGGKTSEEECKGASTYFRTAYRELGKVLNPEEGAEELSIREMEVKVEQVREVWLPKIKDRDPNCNTGKLEAEAKRAEEIINQKKGDGFFMPQGDYTASGVWEKLVVDSPIEYGSEVNTQSLTLHGNMGPIEGTMSFPANELNPEYFVFKIKNFGNGAIIPIEDEHGKVVYYQMPIMDGDEILALIVLSNQHDRQGLETLIKEQTQLSIEKKNLDPFIKKNLGKVLVSNEGPIYVNGKKGGQAVANEVALIDSFNLGEPLWARIVIKDNMTPIELLKMSGFPPAGKIGVAIVTKILVDGKLVGQDMLRCTKAADIKITNEATSYREAVFKPNGNVQDAYGEGFKGIFEQNPSIGKHTLEIQKWAVNYNIVDTTAGEGENKFPLEVLMATSGELTINITPESWKPFCNSGESNYGPTQGVVNNSSKSILALAKKEAARAGWKEKPFACRYVGKYEKYHEVTGVHMYPVYKEAVKSRMPNGSIVEQIILMANGAFYGVGSGTHRFLPPKCN
ncbi:MAG: hypothetical protein AAF969_09070 [Bacteroidota bacterium]